MRKTILIILIVLYGAVAVAQKPTRQEFVAVCDSLGVKHPNVVWAQARLESGNFESKTYKQKHNCLGIYDSKRKQYCKHFLFSENFDENRLKDFIKFILNNFQISSYLYDEIIFERCN